MRTITREQLRERAREKVKSLEFIVTQTAFADSRAELEEELELARITLASLEAEAVAVTDDMAYAFHHALSDSSLGADEVEEIKAGLRAAFANVTAPPAPVSVPTFEEWCERTQQNPLGWVRDAMKEAYDGCRAAMLQGADGTLTNEGTIPDNTSCKLRDAVDAIRNSGIAIDGEKILAERDALNSPVIPDGWKLVPIEPTEHMIVEGFESEPDEFFSDAEVWEAYDAMSGCQQAAHRAKLCWAAMLAAAPKPEA